LLIFSKGLPAQNIFLKKLDNTKNIDYSTPVTTVRFSLVAPVNSSVLFSGKAVIQPGYYVSGLGFFCRNEVRMDRILPIRFRVRLGDLGYVNKLEGK
jgi:hypothetical protein